MMNHIVLSDRELNALPCPQYFETYQQVIYWSVRPITALLKGEEEARWKQCLAENGCFFVYPFAIGVDLGGGEFFGFLAEGDFEIRGDKETHKLEAFDFGVLASLIGARLLSEKKGTSLSLGKFGLSHMTRLNVFIASMESNRQKAIKTAFFDVMKLIKKHTVFTMANIHGGTYRLERDDEYASLVA